MKRNHCTEYIYIYICVCVIVVIQSRRIVLSMVSVKNMIRNREKKTGSKMADRDTAAS